jgi:hypothetical protein
MTFVSWSRAGDGGGRRKIYEAGHLAQAFSYCAGNSDTIAALRSTVEPQADVFCW